MTVHWSHPDDVDQLPGFKCAPGRVYKTRLPKWKQLTVAERCVVAGKRAGRIKKLKANARGAVR